MLVTVLLVDYALAVDVSIKVVLMKNANHKLDRIIALGLTQPRLEPKSPVRREYCNCQK